MRLLCLLYVVVSGAVALPFSPETGEREETPLWVRSGKWQGDIILTPEQEFNMRNGIRDTRHRWANATVPYKLKAGAFSAAEANIITSALERYNQQTCVTVREATPADGNKYVLVTRENSGCWSYLGYIGFLGSNYQPQELNLGTGCITPGITLHEFLHAFGFQHQHSATNRDDYINIYPENIQDAYLYAFDKEPAPLVTDYGCKYDLDSVLHYNRYAFSKNSLPTILVKNDPNYPIGQRVGFTDIDIKKLNCMYVGYNSQCACRCP